MFPCSSAVKAPYGAIGDSPGRAIDRFAGCEPPWFFMLACSSRDAHAGQCFGRGSQMIYGSVMQYNKIFIVAIQRRSVKSVLRGVHVLEQKCGIQISLDASTVRHIVPSLSERLLLIFARNMIELACPDGGLHFDNAIQPA